MPLEGKRICKLGVILLAVVLFAMNRPVRGQQDAPPEILAYADMVVYNGKVLTADEKFTTAEAIAIRDGKFLAIGTTDRISKMAGPKTQKIDLHGKTLTPGFIATHAHTWSGNPNQSGDRGSLIWPLPGYD